MDRSGSRAVSIVLLVDDQEQHFLAAMARAFRRLVPHVYTALDGARGLEIAVEVRPELVIVDEVMPGMSGIETIEKLKRLLPDAFAILHGGNLCDETRRRAAQAGADACVDKPASAVELLACVYRSASDDLDAITRAHVERALHEANGNITEAARRLGLSRRGLQKKLRKWGLHVPGGGGGVAGREGRAPGSRDHQPPPLAMSEVHRGSPSTRGGPGRGRRAGDARCAARPVDPAEQPVDRHAAA